MYFAESSCLMNEYLFEWFETITASDYEISAMQNINNTF